MLAFLIMHLGLVLNATLMSVTALASPVTPGSHDRIGQEIASFSIEQLSRNYSLGCRAKQPSVRCTRTIRGVDRCITTQHIECTGRDNHVDFKVRSDEHQLRGIRIGALEHLVRDGEEESDQRPGEETDEGSDDRPITGTLFGREFVDNTFEFLRRGGYTCDKDPPWIIAHSWGPRVLNCKLSAIDPSTGIHGVKIRVFKTRRRVTSVALKFITR